MPMINRIKPTVRRETPSTEVVTAKRRIAPAAIKTIDVPIDGMGWIYPDLRSVKLHEPPATPSGFGSGDRWYINYIEEIIARRFPLVALLVLVLILAVFGGLGFAIHLLWYLLIVAVLLWLIGFFIGGVEGGRRRWYRW